MLQKHDHPQPLAKMSGLQPEKAWKHQIAEFTNLYSSVLYFELLKQTFRLRSQHLKLNILINPIKQQALMISGGSRYNSPAFHATNMECEQQFKPIKHAYYDSS